MADAQRSPLQGRRTYGNIVGRGLGPAAKGFSWRRSLFPSSVTPNGVPPVNQGMIAPGNHVDFRFAARSTTPRGKVWRAVIDRPYMEHRTAVRRFLQILPVRLREGQDPPLQGVLRICAKKRDAAASRFVITAPWPENPADGGSEDARKCPPGCPPPGSCPRP